LFRLISLYLRTTDRYSVSHEELLLIDPHYSAWYYPSVTNPSVFTRAAAPLIPSPSPKTTSEVKQGRYTWLPRASLSDRKYARALQYHQESLRAKERPSYAWSGYLEI